MLADTERAVVAGPSAWPPTGVKVWPGSTGQVNSPAHPRRAEAAEEIGRLSGAAAEHAREGRAAEASGPRLEPLCRTRSAALDEGESRSRRTARNRVSRTRPPGQQTGRRELTSSAPRQSGRVRIALDLAARRDALAMGLHAQGRRRRAARRRCHEASPVCSDRSRRCSPSSPAPKRHLAAALGVAGRRRRVCDREQRRGSTRPRPCSKARTPGGRGLSCSPAAVGDPTGGSSDPTGPTLPAGARWAVDAVTVRRHRCWPPSSSAVLDGWPWSTDLDAARTLVDRRAPPGSLRSPRTAMCSAAGFARPADRRPSPARWRCRPRLTRRRPRPGRGERRAWQRRRLRRVEADRAHAGPGRRPRSSHTLPPCTSPTPAWPRWPSSWPSWVSKPRARRGRRAAHGGPSATEAGLARDRDLAGLAELEERLELNAEVADRGARTVDRIERDASPQHASLGARQPRWMPGWRCAPSRSGSERWPGRADVPTNGPRGASGRPVVRAHEQAAERLRARASSGPRCAVAAEQDAGPARA